MAEKPRPIANLDDDDATADMAVASGPLATLVERESGPGTVESVDAPRNSTSAAEGRTASIEYAAGTTEHDDDDEA